MPWKLKGEEEKEEKVNNHFHQERILKLSRFFLQSSPNQINWTMIFSNFDSYHEYGWTFVIPVPQVLLRYYHVFEEGELEELVEKVEELVVVESYYDQGNWCSVLERV